jgi:hypothetical protein
VLSQFLLKQQHYAHVFLLFPVATNFEF